MNLKVITDVTDEPLGEDFIVNYVKYTGGDADETALINSMAKAARQLIERKYNLALAAQTLQLDVRKKDINNYSIQLPRYPQKGYNSNDATEFKVYTVDSEETETLLTYNDGYFLCNCSSIYIKWFIIRRILYVHSTNIYYDCI